VTALLEDRRLRAAEEEARSSACSKQMAHLETSLAEAERLLTRSTRDYLQLRHESVDAECVFRVRVPVSQPALERDTYSAVFGRILSRIHCPPLRCTHAVL